MLAFIKDTKEFVAQEFRVNQLLLPVLDNIASSIYSLTCSFFFRAQHRGASIREAFESLLPLLDAATQRVKEVEWLARMALLYSGPRGVDVMVAAWDSKAFKKYWHGMATELVKTDARLSYCTKAVTDYYHFRLGHLQAEQQSDLVMTDEMPANNVDLRLNVAAIDWEKLNARVNERQYLDWDSDGSADAKGEMEEVMAELKQRLPPQQQQRFVLDEDGNVEEDSMPDYGFDCQIREGEMLDDEEQRQRRLDEVQARDEARQQQREEEEQLMRSNRYWLLQIKTVFYQHRIHGEPLEQLHI